MSDAVNVVPVPWISVLTVSLLSGFAFGMVTLGALSNAPVAVTEPPPAVAPALADDDEVDLPELQAARVRQAIRGTAMSARKRRMKTSMMVDGQRTAYWHGEAGASAGYIPAMSFSTRSSTER